MINQLERKNPMDERYVIFLLAHDRFLRKIMKHDLLKDFSTEIKDKIIEHIFKRFATEKSYEEFPKDITESQIIYTLEYGYSPHEIEEYVKTIKEMGDILQLNEINS
jgi:hypothetical protein